MKKKTLSLLFIFLFAFVLSIPAFAMVSQSDSFYICDDAGVLSDSLEQDIIALNGRLENQCKGAQLVIVSVDYMDGLYADEYAYALMNEWGVGDASENNGMLLLFAVKENRGWLAVGDGILGSFGSSAADHYLDQYFWDSYDKGDYETGVKKLSAALEKWYMKHYNVSSGTAGSSSSGYATNPGAVSGSTTSEGSPLGSLVLLIIVFLLLRNSRRRRGGGVGLWPLLFLNSARRNNNSRPVNNYRPTSSSSFHSSGSSRYTGSSSHSSFGGGGRSGGGSFHSSGHGGGGHSGGGGGRR